MKLFTKQTSQKEAKPVKIRESQSEFYLNRVNAAEIKILSCVEKRNNADIRLTKLKLELEDVVGEIRKSDTPEITELMTRKRQIEKEIKENHLKDLAAIDIKKYCDYYLDRCEHSRESAEKEFNLETKGVNVAWKGVTGYSEFQQSNPNPTLEEIDSFLQEKGINSLYIEAEKKRLKLIEIKNRG